MAKKNKGMFGMSDDVASVGIAIIGTGLIDLTVNKVILGHGHGHRGGGGDRHIDPPGHDEGGGGRVSDYIGEISAHLGLPKESLVKGSIALGGLFLAEKMPQHRSALLMISAVLGYQALTAHPKVRHVLGIHDVNGTEVINALEADLRREIEGLKEEMSGITLAGPMDGVTLADHVEGTEMAANFNMSGPNQFNALGF